MTKQRDSKTQNICKTFIQCWTNVENVGPSLYKCYTNILRLLGPSRPRYCNWSKWISKMYIDHYCGNPELVIQYVIISLSSCIASHDSWCGVLICRLKFQLEYCSTQNASMVESTHSGYQHQSSTHHQCHPIVASKSSIVLDDGRILWQCWAEDCWKYRENNVKPKYYPAAHEQQTAS